jgi:hypothetical protein
VKYAWSRYLKPQALSCHADIRFVVIVGAAIWRKGSQDKAQRYGRDGVVQGHVVGRATSLNNACRTSAACSMVVTSRWTSTLYRRSCQLPLFCSISTAVHNCSQLLTDSSSLDKYHYLVAKAFVRDNRCVKWCPAPGCQFALKLGYQAARNVTCRCGHTFCFACSQAKHNPIRYTPFPRLGLL